MSSDSGGQSVAVMSSNGAKTPSLSMPFSGSQASPWPFISAISQSAPFVIEDITPHTTTPLPSVPEETAFRSDDQSSPLAYGPYEFEERGWKHANPRSAVVLPIYIDSDTGNVPVAMLVSGISSLSSWDANLSTFFQLLGKHLASGITAMKRVEDDQKRFCLRRRPHPLVFSTFLAEPPTYSL